MRHHGRHASAASISAWLASGQTGCLDRNSDCCFIATGQFLQVQRRQSGAREIFDGLLVVDSLTNYIRVFIYSFTFLVIVLRHDHAGSR